MIYQRRERVINAILILLIILSPYLASYLIGYGDTYRNWNNALSGVLVMLGYYMRMVVEWSRNKNA